MSMNQKYIILALDIFFLIFFIWFTYYGGLYYWWYILMKAGLLVKMEIILFNQQSFIKNMGLVFLLNQN